MKEYDEIARKLRELINVKPTVVNGIVKSVDVDKKTCTVQVNGLNIYNIRLSAVTNVSDKGIVVIPKSNTNVLVARIGMENEWCIIHIEEVEEVHIACDNIKINGGTLGGLVKVDELVSQINDIKNDINELKTAMTSWVVVPMDGGAALKAVTATWAALQLPTLVKATIEDTKVKH